MKRFIKHNYKYLTALVLLVLFMGITLHQTRIRSVDEVRQEALRLSETVPQPSAAPQNQNGVQDRQGGQTDGEQKPDEAEPAETEQAEPSAADPAKSPAETAQPAADKKNTADRRGAAESGAKKDTSKKSSSKSKGTTPSQSSRRKISDGNSREPDQYHTDPVPSGKPEPVNAEDQSVNENTSFYVYLGIDVLTVLDHMDDLKPGLERYIPEDGWIIPKTRVLCYEGETAWDVMSRECKARGINVQSSYTQIYGSVYLEGIHNIGEFSCGAESGWIYEVDGWIPNYASSRYVLEEGEYVRWRYSCTGFGSDLDGIHR